MVHPDQDDVVVRQRRGNPHVVYLVGTPATPDQFGLRTRRVPWHAACLKLGQRGERA